MKQGRVRLGQSYSTGHRVGSWGIPGKIGDNPKPGLATPAGGTWGWHGAGPTATLSPLSFCPLLPLPFSMARVASFTNLVPAWHPGVGPHRLSLPAWCPRPTVPLTPRPAPVPRVFPFPDCPLSCLPSPSCPCASCSPRVSPASLAELRVSQQRWPYLPLGMAWQLLGHLQGQRHLRRGQMGFVTRYSLRSHEPPLWVPGSGRSGQAVRTEA